MRNNRILLFFLSASHQVGLRSLRWMNQRIVSRRQKLFKKSCTDLEGVVQSAHLPGPCRSGGTGRRKGLKIPRLERAVPVQVRPPAPIYYPIAFPFFVPLFRTTFPTGSSGSVVVVSFLIQWFALFGYRTFFPRR